MQVECPACSTGNKIEFGEHIVCCECKKTFAGHSYKKFKKPFLSTSAALFVGVFVTHNVEQAFFDKQRYPLSVEYELIDSCVNSSRMPRTAYRQVDKTKVCLCALDKTTHTISYKDMKKSEPEFLARFKHSIASCS